MGKQFIQHLVELTRHRTLVSALAGRELKGRYRGSLLGFLWTFFKPPFAAFGLRPGIQRLFPRADGKLRGVHVHRPFALDIFLPGPDGGHGQHLRRRQPGDQGSLSQQVLPAVKVAANFINYLLSLPFCWGFFWLAA